LLKEIESAREREGGGDGGARERESATPPSSKNKSNYQRNRSIEK